MELTNNKKFGVLLLVTGTVLNLLHKICILLQPSEVYNVSHRIIRFAFGKWLADLIAPGIYNGISFRFLPSSLLWIPWSAVAVFFILWICYKIYKDQVLKGFYNVLIVLGLWLSLGVLTEDIMYYLFSDFNHFALLYFLGFSSDILRVIGIGILIFKQKELFSKQEMSFKKILFSFNGRISRSDFWLFNVIAINLIALFIIYFYNNNIGLIINNTYYSVIGMIISLIGVLTIMWLSLALNVKRCHDRNRSGIFILVACVPILNLWYIIEIYFLRGTDGDNNYGSDPLGSVFK